ncbi:hypothetical protein MASR2M18_21970 [Ignavibacteria bacterium]
MSEAIDDLDKALTIDANYGVAYLGRGLAKASLGIIRRAAAEDFTKAIIINPDDAQSYLERGTVRF